MIAKLLHEGETITQLKNVIKYNSVAKEYLNSINNPRLLEATSNLGIIDISDQEAYQYFMNAFIDEISLNKSISTNKRQKKLYAHEVISFEDQDNQQHSQTELTNIAIESLNNLYDMDNTPYVIWKQMDSGRLHFHVVRSMYNNKGIYQRLKNSKLKMRQCCEQTEQKYSLFLTGKNVSDEIKPANNPMQKVIKNRKLEAEFKHQKSLTNAITQESSLSSIKRKSYNLLMDDTYKNTKELVEEQAYQNTQQMINSTEKINSDLETIKNTIFKLYKNSTDETDFIGLIEKQGITIELLKHSKSGKNKGIVFHHNGQVISGSKISSSMTLGKIKSRYPNFIHTLEKPPILHSTSLPRNKMFDFNIEQINKYYKQRKNRNTDDILIYFGKKNVEARPYNYNLKLSSNRDSIRFGPSAPNDHDLTLSINVALENGWNGATLTNSSPKFLKRMMKAAYMKDPNLLFFVKSNKPHQLRYSDLKEIKPALTSDDLKTALTSKLISKEDLQVVHQHLVTLLESQASQPEQKGYALALNKGFSLTELDKKSPIELQQFYRYNTFEITTKTHLNAKIDDQEFIKMKERESYLKDIKSEVESSPITLSNDRVQYSSSNKIKPQ